MCIGEDDEELVSELQTAKEVWQELKKKYADNQATGRKLMKQYFSFQKTEDMSIDGAWTYLQALGKRIKVAQPEMAAAINTKARAQVLLSGLPDQWSTIRDAIDGQPSLSPESILSILQEKEVSMPASSTPVAFAARAASSRGSSSQRGRRSDSKMSDRQGTRCKLCNQNGHYVTICPYLEMAQGVIKVVSESKVSDSRALALVAQDQDDDWDEEMD